MVSTEWKVVFVPAAQADLAGLDRGLKRELFRKLDQIKIDPTVGKPLTGNLLHLRKKYFDKKNYRIVYEVKSNEGLVIVWGIGKRKKLEVYSEVMKRIQES